MMQDTDILDLLCSWRKDDLESLSIQERNTVSEYCEALADASALPPFGVSDADWFDAVSCQDISLMPWATRLLRGETCAS